MVRCDSSVIMAIYFCALNGEFISYDLFEENTLLKILCSLSLAAQLL
jgi:hypothetical protein